MGLREGPRRPPTERADPRWECPLGWLSLDGKINSEEYEAGCRYRETALRYLRSIEAPNPHPGSCDLIRPSYGTWTRTAREINNLHDRDGFDLDDHRVRGAMLPGPPNLEPDFGGGEYGDTDDEALSRKLAYSQALDLLKRAGKNCRVAVDRVAVYEEAPRDEEIFALRAGLQALARGKANGKTDHKSA